jgi:Recombination, repair and ssDNA binding protein UvsY
MKIEEISQEWINDAKIDTTELDIESIKIPQLHSKYLKIYFEERRKLKVIEFQSKELFLNKYEYYNGRLSDEELEKLDWKPFVKRLMKNEIDLYIESDKDIIHNNMRIVNQKEKLDMLEEILKNLNQRNFQIKNAIDWKKFTQGVQ